jgi:PadR family transcriptional regulator, regulatory protein AphA
VSLPHLLLGLLVDAPLSGYDLYRVFQSTVQHFWTTDQSQIYRALYKMKADGWVDVEVIHQTDNPDKKLYHVTNSGRAELRQWLMQPIEDDPPREAWLGQLFFGDQTPTEDMLNLLNGYMRHLRTQIDVFTALEAALTAGMPDGQLTRPMFFRIATLQYGLAKHLFELDWVTALHRRIQATFQA